MAAHPQLQDEPGPHTWRDFIELGEDDCRELIDGHFMEIEVPSRTHEEIVAALIGLLFHWSFLENAGKVLASGYKLRVGEKSGLMPDVQFFRRGNLPGPDQEQGLERGAPDLVIEVISPTSRSKDRVRKLRDYAAIGVPEYWIVDPEARTLERFVLREGLYSLADALEGAATFRPASFAGLEIPLARLWSEP